MHDVAVVGGSLAGAMTAFHLARMGRSVVLLERSAGPRRKACGEGLFLGGIRELEAAGLGDALAACSVPLDALRFHAGPEVATARLAARGVRRDLLDPLVLDLARRAGVEVRQGVAVQSLEVREGRAVGLRTTGGPVAASVFVGADGLNSRVRRLAGLDRPHHGDRYGISTHICLEDVAPPRVDVHFRRDHELYVTPVGPREVNVALLARKPFLAPFAGDITGKFQAFVASSGVAPAGFTPAGDAAAAGPFSRSARWAWRANVVLAGDAAGFFDGITGEGMSVALVSARHCAVAVDAFLRDGDYAAFREYARVRAALARNSEVFGRISLFVGGRPALARCAVRNLGRHPATFNRLVCINTGERSLLSLHPRDPIALALGI